MNKEELQALAKVATKNLKTEQDLNEFSEMPTKITVEAALNAVLDDHLGYSKHEKTDTDNSPKWLHPQNPANIRRSI